MMKKTFRSGSSTQHACSLSMDIFDDEMVKIVRCCANFIELVNVQIYCNTN